MSMPVERNVVAERVRDRIVQPIFRRLQPVVWRAAAFEPVRRALYKYYDRKSKRSNPIHPFDQEFHVDTSGHLQGTVLGLGRGGDPSSNTGYGGSQPSMSRTALSVIPNPERLSFVDIGCGKGRALIVASEFPFRSVVGIEIAPELVRIAKNNAAVIAREHPGRPLITLVEGSALDVHNLPSGDLVVYLYTPFGENSTEQLRKNIEYLLSQEPRTVYVVSCNPIWAESFDRSPMLKRIYAETIPCYSSEIGYGPDSSTVVIIWQDRNHAPAEVPAKANRPIVLTKAGWHVELADLPD
jgi:SAM-dependent methyltransferase